jgi:hypothetical protein
MGTAIVGNVSREDLRAARTIRRRQTTAGAGTNHEQTEGDPDMSTHETGTFQMKSWEEKPVDEIEGAPKLTRTSVVYAYSGPIAGEGNAQGLIFYNDEQHADFTGMERVQGRVGDRTGSFVLQHAGNYEGTVATWKVTVVPGSGTGELKGLRGTGHLVANHGDESHEYEFDYDFE